MEEEFKFLVIKNPDNGLTFLALDSVVGYIRHLSKELGALSKVTDDSAMIDIISGSLYILAKRFESMDG